MPGDGLAVDRDREDGQGDGRGWAATRGP
jgi:hypothetical protein